MELEEAIKNVKDEINVDKNNLPIAEANEYEEERTLMLNRIEAKETILNHITKQEKMIELMSKFIDTELSSEHLSKVLKIEVKPLETYRENIKKYFEKKAEESE